MAKVDASKNSPAAPLGLWDADHVAREMGVTAALARELQAGLVPDVDLRVVRGITVFTEPGLAKLRTLVEARMAGEKKPGPIAPAAAAAPALETEDLTVTRVFPWSPRILCVRANELEVVLEVKSSKQLQPGMVLKDCVCGRDGWFYYGPLPRSTGECQLFFPHYKKEPDEE